MKTTTMLFSYWKQLMLDERLPGKEYLSRARYRQFWDNMNPNYTKYMKEFVARIITRMKGVRTYNEMDWK